MGLSSSDDVLITVLPTNLPPTVSAGSNQTITLPSAASLIGSASDDNLPTGSTLTTLWSKVSGPGTVVFGNAAALFTTATFSSAGNYVLRLTAFDGQLTVVADVVITVNAAAVVNQAPDVYAGPDQTIELPSVASLLATATDDGLPVGSTLGFQWSKVSGSGTVQFSNPTNKMTDATFPTSGPYVLRFTATEIDQATGSVGTAAGVGTASAVSKLFRSGIGTAAGAGLGAARSPTLSIAVAMGTGTASAVGSDASAAGSAVEEFVGPFPSWMNVKTQFGAAGNGVADDTAEIQAGLDALSGSSPVLYLPAGTYKISSTLSVAEHTNVSIIGEDPATTKILWAGGASGVMLLLADVSYSRISRLTFDGDEISGTIGVDQNQPDINGLDTGNEYSDCVFVDLGFGIRGGESDFGFAETTVLRCTFLRIASHGICLGNFNALDLFVWYCRFESCGYAGISNNHGGGNFNVYHSVFKNNNKDMLIDAAGAFSCRHNYSINSNHFFECYTTMPTITFQGNTILDPVAPNDPFQYPIVMQHFGTTVMLDNTIRSLVGVVSDGVVKEGYSNGDLFSMGNKFTSTGYYNDVAGRIHSIDDTVVSRASITTAEPTLPSTPPNLGTRTIYEIAPGASTATIQSTINTASAGTRAVVHIPPGTLMLTATLTIPAGSDIQIIGDGRESKLFWNTGGSGPMIQLASPARAVIRDLQLMGNDTANGIVVDDCDQSGARVFIDQPYLENINKNVVVNGLDFTDVRFRSLYHKGDNPVVVEPSVEIIGGGASGGMTSIHGGASDNAVVAYGVSGTAHLHLRDIWYETNSFDKFIELSGSGTFTFGGFRLNVLGSPGPAVDVSAFTGKAAMLSSKVDGDFIFSGSSSGGQVAVIGMIGPDTGFITNTTSPATTALFINNQYRPTSDTTAQLSEVGTYSPTLLTNVLAEERALSFVAIGSIAAGKTDLRMYRVTVGQCLIGIQLN